MQKNAVRTGVCRWIVISLVVLAASALAADQQFASLGDFSLDSGEVLRDCRIGYRIEGKLAADKGNIIVVPTWLAGRSADMAGWMGEGNLFDTSKYYVIVVDAFGDGESSSPSNSATQPREKFPRFTIRDMVRAQHELLTRILKFDHVYAIGGLSMGGIQTFEWISIYPDFMDKAVSITGTPKQTAYDLILWRTELEILERAGGSRDAIKEIAAINDLHLRTPDWTAKNVTDVDKTLADHVKALDRLDPFDHMSQLRAMIAHDITPDFHPPLKPKMFIAVALQDHMVNPGPAREFARVHGTAVLTLSGDCGHIAPGCERELLKREVSRFLER